MPDGYRALELWSIGGRPVWAAKRGDDWHDVRTKTPVTQSSKQSGVTFVVDGDCRTQGVLLRLLTNAGLRAMGIEDMWTCAAAGVDPLEGAAVGVYLPKRMGSSAIERAVGQRQVGWAGESVVVWPMIPEDSLALRWPWAVFVGVEATETEEALLEAVLKQCGVVAAKYAVPDSGAGGRGLDVGVGLSTFSLDGRARAA